MQSACAILAMYRRHACAPSTKVLSGKDFSATLSRWSGVSVFRSNKNRENQNVNMLLLIAEGEKESRLRPLLVRKHFQCNLPR